MEAAAQAAGQKETMCVVEDGAPQNMVAKAQSFVPHSTPIIHASWVLDSLVKGAALDWLPYQAAAPAPSGSPDAPSRKRSREHHAEESDATKTARVDGTPPTAPAAAAGSGGGEQHDCPSPTPGPSLGGTGQDTQWRKSLPHPLHSLADMIVCAGGASTSFHPPPEDTLGPQHMALLSPAQRPQPLSRDTWYCIQDGKVQPGFASIAGEGKPAASACTKQKGIASMFQARTALVGQAAAQSDTAPLHHKAVPLLHDYSRWGEASVFITKGWGVQVGLCDPPSAAARAPLLAIDVDDTLIRTAKTCKVFAESADDWAWWHADVPAVLKRIHDAGVSIALLTNQSGASGADAARRAPLIRDKLGGIAHALLKEGVPTCTVAATGNHDFFRKPRPGMWLLAQQLLAATAAGLSATTHTAATAASPHMLRLCAYVGDAAGRSLEEKTKHASHIPLKTPLQKSKPKRRQDHGTSDLLMACNAGIAFLTPDALFAGAGGGTCSNAFLAASLRSAQGAFPRRVFSEASLQQRKHAWQTHVDTLVALQAASPCVFVSVGAPGSGKSTWASAVAGSLPANMQGPVVVNQDTLRSKDKCLAAAEAALLGGQSVIVDATNATCQVRDAWVQLARQHAAKSVAILFPQDLQRSLHLNAFRGSCPFPLPCGSAQQRYVPSRALLSLQPQGGSPGDEFDSVMNAKDPPLPQLADKSASVLRMWLK